MKILFLATIYEHGGLSNLIRTLLDNFNREGNDIVFLVERLDTKHYPLRDDIKFINLDVKPAKGGFRKLIHIFKYLYRLRKSIIHVNPDVIIGFGFPVNCLYLFSFLWPLKNRPKVIFGGYTEMIFIKQKARTIKEAVFKVIYRTVMFFLYHRADAIVCVSRSLASHIEKFFLMDKSKIKVVPSPVNIKKIQVCSQEEIDGHKDNLPWIGTVSRLSAEKGVNYLIEAFSQLVKKIDSRLIIIGDGKERSNLERMASDLGIRNRVDFLGWMSNPYNYLKKMEVFVLSSLWEGFPQVIIESMVCGVPVVATRSVGGIEEAIRDEVDGILVPSKDVNALSDSIYRLLKDRELRDRLVREASKKIDRFDSCKITKEYESVIPTLFKE
ncbi:glycosyltransferase [Candidatus Omnitrophota bacterium]